MKGLFLFVALGIAIFAGGLLIFFFLLKRYKEKLLINFEQKIWMTVALGVTYLGLFLLLNGSLVSLPKQDWVENFPFLIKHPWLLIKAGLTLFLFNACLILAFRSIYKGIFSWFREKR